MNIDKDLMWDYLVARKLHNTAKKDERWEDANYYLKQMQAAEFRLKTRMEHGEEAQVV